MYTILAYEDVHQSNIASRPCTSTLPDLLLCSSTLANVIVLTVQSKLCFGRVGPGTLWPN